MRSRSVISCIVIGLGIAASSAAFAQDKPPEPSGDKPAEGATGDKPAEGTGDKPAEPTPTATTTAPAPTAPTAEPPPSTPPTTTAGGGSPTTTGAPVGGPAFSATNPPPTADTGATDEKKKSEPPPESAFGIEADLGAMGRVDGGGSFERGGLTFGPSVWLSPMRMFAVGLGYQRLRGGVDRSQTGAEGVDVQRDMDLAWLYGRVYPWRTDAMGVYLTLGFGGVWQHAQASGNSISTSGAVASPQPYSCSGSAGPALAFGGGAGFDLDVGHDWSFITQADLVTYRNSSDKLGSCAEGAGPTTGLGARIGFAYRFDLGNGPAKTAKASHSTRL